MPLVLDRIVIVGVGLIGGSFALALREAGLGKHFVGVGRSRASLETALKLKLVDEIASLEEMGRAVREADLVLIATPIAQIEPVLQSMAPHLGANTVVTDAGSVKGPVIESARRALGERFAQFVPGHPIAGREASGPEAAQHDLYRQRTVVLTPTPDTDLSAVERVRQAWTACGGQVEILAALRHDALFAAVSHLPHVAAFAYMNAMVLSDDSEARLRLAGSGFRDFTRIAASHPEMWRDIVLSNREAVLKELNGLRAQLDWVAAKLEQSDASALDTLFSRASAARRGWRLSNSEE